MGIENPIHLLFIGAVALLVLGPKRLPGLARALGHGIREFREAIGQGGAEPSEPPTQLGPALTHAGEPLAEPATHSQAASPGEEPRLPVDPVEPIRSGDAPDRRPL